MIGLCDLENLEVLSLNDVVWEGQLPDTFPKLTKLKYLYLSNTGMYDISPIIGLNNLYELDLSRNQISDISALETLTSLHLLYLSSNLIEDIAVLQDSKTVLSLIFLIIKSRI